MKVKTVTFFLPSVLILMSMCSHGLANISKEEEESMTVRSSEAWPFPWGRQLNIPYKPKPRPRPRLPFPKPEKCWLPIVKVENCGQQIVEALWSRHFELISRECCEAVIQAGKDCHAKAFIGPFSVQLFSYCSSTLVAPPPSA
ncbi:hypothetical protein LguiB_023206 [Lonicera macranthoides]